MVELEAWATDISYQIYRKPNSTKIHAISINDIEITVNSFMRNGLYTSSISVYNKNFEILANGENSISKIKDGGILNIKSGQLLSPWDVNSFILKSNNKEDIATEIAERKKELETYTIKLKNDIIYFGSYLSSLTSVYCELISESPKFKYAHPKPGNKRRVYASIVAYLLNKPWRPYFDSLVFNKTEIMTDWPDDVRKRIEEKSS